MEIKKFIKIYDEILPWKTLSNLIRYINTIEFTDAEILGDQNGQMVDSTIRKTQVKPITNIYTNSMSEVHWSNILKTNFKNKLNLYRRDNNIIDFDYRSIIDISILKYKSNGFYIWHTDHAAEIPRTMSCILLLNNDYEGGNLCFRNPDGSGEWEVEVKSNRILFGQVIFYIHIQLNQ